MTKEEFKARWESNDEGGGLTYDDLATCAIEWGISRSPRIHAIDKVRYLVLHAAGTVDAEEYNPNKWEDDEED